MRRFLVIALLPFFWALPLHAQEDDSRQLINQAEQAYEIGQIEEAQNMLRGHLEGMNSTLKLRGYRLLSLCCLALDQDDEARRYASLVLKENPYYSPTAEYPPRFVDMITELRQGQIATITTASNQSESINEAPSPVTIITAEMIEELGYNKNLNQILAAYVPGMVETCPRYIGENLATHSAYSYNQELILIMENGHRLNSREDNIGPTSYSISTEKIDHIEVLRGPASSLYGNVAVTAVVNIITKSGRNINGLKARYGNGTFGTHRADILFGTQFMDADITAWASIYKSNGQIRHFNDGDGYYSDMSTEWKAPSDYVFYGPDRIYVDSYRNSPSYDVGLTFSLKGFNLLLSRKSSKKLPPVASAIGYDYDLYPYIYGIMPGFCSESTHAELGYNRMLGRFSLNASLYGDWCNASRYDIICDRRIIQYQKYDEETGEIFCDEDGNPVDFTYEINGEWEYDNFKETTIGTIVKAGTDYQLGRMKGSLLVGGQYESFSLYSMIYLHGIEFGSVDYGASTTVDYLKNAKEHTLSFFLQDKHYITPKFIVNLGARYDIKSREFNSINAFSPRLALLYVPNNKFSLKLSYSEAYADLAYSYRYYFQGREFSVDPLHTSAIQLTAMGKAPQLHLNYEVNAFYNKYDNLLQWTVRDDAPVNEDYSLNNGSLTSIGLECSASYSHKRASANLSLYYCKDLRAKNYNYNESKNEVTGVPHFTLNLHGAWKLIQQKNHELKVYGHAAYSGRKLNYMPLEAQDYYLDAKLLFDLGLKYSYGKHLQFALDCENLFNTDHYVCGPDPKYLPHFQRGRTLMASISFGI